MKPRRLLQYRLSSLFIVVTICALFLGYVVNSRFKKRITPNSPMFHLQSNGALLDFISPSAEKHLVQDANGEFNELFDYKLLNVKVLRKDFDFGALRYLADLPNIGELDFSGSGIINDDLVHLAHCPSAKVLSIHNTELQDGNYRVLEKLRYLERLNLNNTRVGDASLESICRLSSLKSLNLSGTSVTDDGVRRISGMAGLQSLDLGHTPISSLALTHIGKLANLEFLSLAGVDLSDADLSCLRSCTKLKNVDLDGTQVTDLVFQQLPGLKMITLSGRGTTEDARREFLRQDPARRMTYFPIDYQPHKNP